MSTDINITYINKSNHRGNPTVLVYMQPPVSPFAAESTAWQVIKNIGYNSWHKFTYTFATSIQVLWGNNGQPETLTMNATNGKNYSFAETDSGFSLIESDSNLAANQFEVTNNTSTLKEISIAALKDGHPIQIKYQVARNQKAVFVINPKLYFGLSSNYKVGDIITPATMNEGFTEVSLEGSSSLSVSMRGDAANGFTFLTFHGKS